MSAASRVGDDAFLFASKTGRVGVADLVLGKGEAATGAPVASPADVPSLFMRVWR